MNLPREMCSSIIPFRAAIMHNLSSNRLKALQVRLQGGAVIGLMKVRVSKNVGLFIAK